MLEPMRDRQKTAWKQVKWIRLLHKGYIINSKCTTSTTLADKGTLLMSQAVTLSFAATRSKE